MDINILNVAFSAFAILVITWAAYGLFAAFRRDRTATSQFSRETKTEERSTIHKLHFIWRKKYKELIVATTGLAVLAIVWVDQAFNITLEAKDELSSIVLLVTAATVFWSTRETFDLKGISNKQLEAHNITEMNRLSPIIVITRGVLHKDGKLDAELRNIGKGIAQNVRIQIHSVDVWGPRVIPVHEKGDNDMRFGISENKDSLVQAINAKSPPESMSIEIKYDDIFGRLYRTVGIKMNPDGNGVYHVATEKWRFRLEHPLPVTDYIQAIDEGE